MASLGSAPRDVIPQPLPSPAISAPPSNTSPNASPDAGPRLLHLQILRTIAASLVVIDHSFFALNGRGYSISSLMQPGILSGYLGVTSFFVLSGLIMQRLADGLFGTRSGPWQFAWQRLLRIVPMYWIATILWFIRLESARQKLPHAAERLVLSLAFLPNFIALQDYMQPVLAQGWTLNYEMTFYLLFALCLFLPRRFGILVLEAILLLIVLAGNGHRVMIGQSPGNLFTFYTSPVILFFAFGVLIGLIETRLGTIGTKKFPISPAWLVLISPILLFFPIYHVGHVVTRVAVTLSALAVVVLCSLAANGRPGRFTRLMVLLGDASYSTYLFHLWPIYWMIPIAERLYRPFHATLASPAVFVALTILAANAFGLLIHLLVERPVTRYLRRIQLPFLPARRATSPQPSPTLFGDATCPPSR